MNPHAYSTLTHAMDSFDVRDAIAGARIRPKLTFVGISSDWLFRPEDVRTAERRCREAGFDATYLELHSNHGHDAFLAEPRELAALLRPLLT
jgi:homoserine O-acetyltransferase/O-succinyltransferase